MVDSSIVVALRMSIWTIHNSRKEPRNAPSKADLATAMERARVVALSGVFRIFRTLRRATVVSLRIDQILNLTLKLNRTLLQGKSSELHFQKDR
jgi:hypothetical protein